LLTGNSNNNLIEELLRAICLGAITGGIINAIFVSSQRGKRLFRSFVILFIYLYLLNIVLYGTSLAVINQSIGNEVFHNFKSLFSIWDFLTVFIAYSIWFLVLWVINRIYRKTTANRVGSKVTSSKNLKEHKQKLQEQAEVEQNAFEMKKEFKERHYINDRRAKRRTINSEAREEIARENRKSNQEKAELEREEKEDKK
jgi:predicted membrane protein